MRVIYEGLDELLEAFATGGISRKETREVLAQKILFACANTALLTAALALLIVELALL